MNILTTRRRFLGSAALAGVGGLSFLSGLSPVSAQEAQLNPKLVQFNPEIEPLVRLIEDTPRNQLMEEIATRVKRGLTYREVLAALFLAGVRNIQPRPVGFKFHAVLVVHSAHLASLSSPDSDRWLPIFWALDQFKSSQARNKQEGDWHMGPVEASAVAASHLARAAFTKAMEDWDVAAADAAVVGLARSAGANEIFEIFCRYGMRDFREIGHKAIYVANSWRTLQAIGWHHSEPVLRSLAYALLDHEGDNPAKRDADPDRPWRRNLELAKSIRADWLEGKPDPAATMEMIKTLREASPEEASKRVVELLNRGVAPQSIWDALFHAGGELLVRQQGIVSLHSMTAANAFHFAFRNSANDETRRLLLLQNAAFITLYRANSKGAYKPLAEFEPLKTNEAGAGAIEEIFADVSSNKMNAARKALAYLQSDPNAHELLNAARRLVFLKGNDAHDYKFSSAVLEDYYQISPSARARYLAASMFYLRGSGAEDTSLAKRIRSALNS